MRRLSSRRGYWLILGAACLWGTTGTAQALGPTGSDPLSVGLIRLLIAGPAMALIAVAMRSFPARSSLPWGPTLVAGLGMAAYQPVFFTAVDRTGVAVGTAVAIGTAPVLTGLVTRIVDGRRLDRAWFASTGLATVGVVILGFTLGRVGADLLGIVAAMGAGLAYAVYVVASTRVVAVAPPIGAMAVVFLTAALFSLPLIPLVDFAFLGFPGGLAMALHLGLLATALAYVLFSTGLRLTPAPVAATLSLAEPATATLLGVAVLGEHLQARSWLALALIFAGLWIVVRSREQTPVPTLAQ